MIKTTVSNPWLVTFRPNPSASMRLFCLPFAGGGATTYSQWLDFMPPQIELVSVQYPGRENRFREQPEKAMPALVEGFLPYLTDHLDKPYAFFGHSMGAIVGFETALRLRESGHPLPQHLFMSAHHAPQCEGRPREVPMYEMDDESFITSLRDFNGTPTAILENEELLKLMLPVLRSDFELCDTYTPIAPVEPLNVPITAFGGMQDGEVAIADVRAWEMQTSATFQTRMFPGDHFFINKYRPMLIRIVVATLLSQR